MLLLCEGLEVLGKKRKEAGTKEVRSICAQVFFTIENISLLLLLTQEHDSRRIQVEKSANSRKELVLL